MRTKFFISGTNPFIHVPIVCKMKKKIYVSILILNYGSRGQFTFLHVTDQERLFKINEYERDKKMPRMGQRKIQKLSHIDASSAHWILLRIYEYMGMNYTLRLHHVHPVRASKRKHILFSGKNIELFEFT